MSTLLKIYDGVIYRLSYGSLRRICARKHGMAVVLKLWLDDYLKAHPVTSEQQKLAEIYYEQNLKRLHKCPTPS